MPTQLEMYNLALSHLKETSLADISEDREARYVLDDWYAQTLKWMIEAGFWKFALRTVKIEADPLVTGAFGPSKIFSLPTDWVRTYIVSASEFLDPPLDEWLEESSGIIADVDPIYMRYVSNYDDGYGYDNTRWTGRFIDAFSYKLAENTAPRISGFSDAALKKLEDKADRKLKEALALEAMREPARRLPQGEWNSARHGSRGGRADYWRYAR
jgi:hypothetical protein